MTLKFGLHTFGDVSRDAEGQPETHAKVLRNIVAEGQLADKLGIDFFGIGEHHRPDYAVSAPEMVLAALAGTTKQIRLGTAVTVLSSADPVRVFEQFSTLDGISAGRAELIVGRGSFIESFPLFGFSLSDYEALFEERLELLSLLLQEKPVTWTGKLRAGLENQEVWPRSQAHDEGRSIPVWVGVGGSSASVVRTAHYNYDLMLAIIGGSPAAFAPYVQLYHQTMARLGHGKGRVGVHSPGHVATTDAAAIDEFYEDWLSGRNRVGAERGWPPGSRAEFDEAISPSGALFVGSVDTVAKKIVRVTQQLGLDRFDMKFASGGVSHTSNLNSIELFATEVKPRVLRELAKA